MSEQKFLDKLNRLDEISLILEKGDCSLEDAIKLYDEGKKLADVCSKILSEAKQKIEVE